MRSRPRFLVVDDEESVREDLREILKIRFDASVDVASDGKETVDRLAASYKSEMPYDVIVLDMMVPRVKGEEVENHFGVNLLENLFNKFCLLDNRTAVVVYTQYVARHDMLVAIRNCVACIRSGATDYILKSDPKSGITNLPALLSSCQQILESKRVSRVDVSLEGWFQEYHDELLSKFSGKAIAPMSVELAKECKVVGEQIGDYMVVAFDSSAEMINLFLSDPRLWNLELLNLPDASPLLND
jgi:CheY-like chemotaxis protein